jgi:hypothetical protein
MFAGDTSRWMSPSGGAVRTALLVRVMQPRGRGTGDRQHVLERDQLVAPADRSEERPRILTVDVLHREEVLAVVATDVGDRHDVVVMERRGDPRLVEEHRDVALIARRVGADPLEHDMALEPFDPDSPREQHLRHPAVCEVLDDLVASESLHSTGVRAHEPTVRSSSRRRQAPGNTVECRRESAVDRPYGGSRCFAIEKLSRAPARKQRDATIRGSA